MDHADIAAETVEHCQADALRRQLGRGTPPARVSKDCIECGEEIPEARRKLGVITCIDCQRNAEARLTMRSHNIRIEDE